MCEEMRTAIAESPQAQMFLDHMLGLAKAPQINWGKLIETVIQIADIIIPLIGGATNATTGSNPESSSQAGTGNAVGSVPDPAS